MGRDNCRLLVKGCGVFIRIRAAERGGNQWRSGRRRWRLVGIGMSTVTFPKYSFLPDIIYSGWAVFLTPGPNLYGDTALVHKLWLPYVWVRPGHRSTEKGAVTTRVCLSNLFWSALSGLDFGSFRFGPYTDYSVLFTPLMEDEVLGRKDFTFCAGSNLELFS